MGTISVTVPVAGDDINAGPVATALTTIANAINGNLDNNNVAAAAAIAVSKLAAGSSGQVLTTTGGVPVWGAGATPGYATTLPGSPTDGQEAILVDSLTVPTFQWRFRWNNGSLNADKWEFVGGAPVVIEVVTDESTASTTYAALATAGPSFTVSRAGVYQVEVGSLIYNASGAAMYHSYDIGGTGAVDADAAAVGVGTVIGAGTSASRVRIKAGVAASTALVSKYKTSTGTAHFLSRWMRVTPVRVS